MALVGVTAALEQVEPLRDPLEQLLGAEQLEPCGGQLDGEREPIEAADQLVHRGRVADIGPDSLRPFDEQRDGISLVHRRQVELGLAGDAQRLAARHQEAKSRSGREQLRNGARCVREQLLQVVEDDMGSLLTDPRRDRGGACTRGAQALGDQGHDHCYVANGCERNEDRAPVRLFGQEPGELDRKPRLARAAGTDDRQQARVAVEPDGGSLEELALAPEEASRRGGKVNSPRRL